MNTDGHRYQHRNHGSTGLSSPVQIERVAAAAEGFIVSCNRTIATIACTLGVGDVQDNTLSVTQFDSSSDFELSSRFSLLLCANQSGYLFAKLFGQIGNQKVHVALWTMHNSSQRLAHALMFSDFHLGKQEAHD